MPKKVKVIETDTEVLDEKLDELVSQIKSEVEPAVDDNKREELVKASEDGYISDKVSAIKKASERSVEKLYAKYLSKRKKDADTFLTDLIISQFASALGGLDAIESPENLTSELKTNVLLKKDIENLVSIISPYIPIVGILSGGATTGKHIYQWKTKAFGSKVSEDPPVEKIQ